MERDQTQTEFAFYRNEIAADKIWRVWGSIDCMEVYVVTKSLYQVAEHSPSIRERTRLQSISGLQIETVSSKRLNVI